MVFFTLNIYFKNMIKKTLKQLAKSLPFLQGINAIKEAFEYASEFDSTSSKYLTTQNIKYVSLFFLVTSLILGIVVLVYIISNDPLVHWESVRPHFVNLKDSLGVMEVSGPKPEDFGSSTNGRSVFYILDEFFMTYIKYAWDNLTFGLNK
jgi:hypothetical protein